MPHYVVVMISIAVANQVVAHAEQVFPRVKEKCAAKGWLANEDVISLEEMIGHLRRLKENMGFIDSRVTAIQAGLDSWQAEQINRRLYYLSFLSMIFLPLSVITGGRISFHLVFLFKRLCQYNKHLQMPISPGEGISHMIFCRDGIDVKELIFFLLFSSASIVFGMNVGGVPWTTQRDPSVKDGFWNVMLLCGALLLFLVVCFTFRALYTRISAWTLRKQRAFRRSASLSRKSFLGRPNLSNGELLHGHYVRI